MLVRKPGMGAESKGREGCGPCRLKDKKSRKKFQGQKQSKQRLRGKKAQGCSGSSKPLVWGMLFRGWKETCGKKGLLWCEVSIYYALDAALNAARQPP